MLISKPKPRAPNAIMVLWSKLTRGPIGSSVLTEIPISTSADIPSALNDTDAFSQLTMKLDTAYIISLMLGSSAMLALNPDA